MVRSPSGVTRMKLRAVAGPSCGRRDVEMDADGLQVVGEEAAESRRRGTLPMKPARPPSEATPTAVLAPDPPETIVAGPMTP